MPFDGAKRCLAVPCNAFRCPIWDTDIFCKSTLVDIHAEIFGAKRLWAGAELKVIDMEFHELANVFPLMTEAELDALGEDMLQHGQRETIWTYKGKILDGRNRYKACMLKGIVPRFVEFRGADPVAFVVSENLHRRHLDAGQRAMFATRLATMKQGQHRSGTEFQIEKTQPEAAALYDVSVRTLHSARKVVDHGTAEVVIAVQHGDVPMKAAAAFVQEYSPTEQAELIRIAGSVLAAVETAKKQPKKKQAKPKPANPKPKPAPGNPPPPPPLLAAANHAQQRAEKSANMKPTADAAERFGSALEALKNIDVKTATAKMADVDRLDLVSEVVDVFNHVLRQIAISGGAHIGNLAPVSRRFEVIKFLEESKARIERTFEKQLDQSEGAQ